MSRAAKIERARIFVGCEGESESGYSVCLANLARDKDLPVTVDAHVMKKGDPLSRIRWAEAKIRQQEQNRGDYAYKFALLDADQRDLDPERARQAIALAEKLGIIIIWQEPDHEGLLLQHFDHEEKRRPRTKAESMAAVLKVWSTYDKGSTAQQYGKKLTQEKLERAGKYSAELNDLLVAIGLIPPPEEKAAKAEPVPKSRKLDLGPDESA